MLRLIFLALFPMLAYAGASDSVIAEIAKRENKDFEVVKRIYEEGCSSGITQSMQACAYYRRIGTDIELNLVYQQLKKQLQKPSAEAKLAKAQRAWLTFREASCTYETDSYVGSRGAGIASSGCYEQITQERIAKLKEYLECKSAGCPGDW